MAEPWTIERAARKEPPIFHPLAGANNRTFWRHYTGNKPFDPRSRAPRSLAAFCSFVRPAFYAIKQFRFGNAIKAHTPSAPPVFIVGHWRSGTTHLHNLLTQDPQFAWITLHQTSNPWSVAGPGIGLIPAIMRMVIPETRGIDNVSLSLDSPQEEEMALGNMNPVSYYNCYYFPREFRRHFNRAILFENLSRDGIEEFRTAYRTLHQRLSFDNGGKRILFKNPASTARIAFLKETFPGAKFIHIVRNPFAVFSSTLAHFPRVMNAFAWHQFDHLDYESITIENYRLLMQDYLKQRRNLDPGDLVETTYEDIIASPREEIERIYDTLDIPGKERALPAIEKYVSTLTGYANNSHALTPFQVERIEKEWGFALEEWAYDVPEEFAVTV